MSSGDGGRLRLLVTGGGTGGHTYPALTTIRAVQQRAEAGGADLEVLWVGVAHGLEARVAVAEGVPFRAITTGRLRRSPNRRELAANLADTARIPVGIGQAIAVVAGFRRTWCSRPAATCRYPSGARHGCCATGW
jgi:UDP-N-acetylglucosamine--N-acetylmuramyl-(pentapeptide) pyrophosphoryl-undecaprenol N-acetylglucosamine transferase